MRVLIHYESVTDGQCAEIINVDGMEDASLMRRLCMLDRDHAVVVGIDCVPHNVRIDGHNETRCLQ